MFVRSPLRSLTLVTAALVLVLCGLSFRAGHSQDKLKADVALVSDTAMYAEGLPTLCIGLRGLVYMEIKAQGPSRDSHSEAYTILALFGSMMTSQAPTFSSLPRTFSKVLPPFTER